MPFLKGRRDESERVKVSMEAELLSKFREAVDHNNDIFDTTSNSRAETLAMSLITNPSTCSDTLSAVLRILTTRSQICNSVSRYHILSLITALARHHPEFGPQVCSVICSDYIVPSTPTRLLVDALSRLLYISNDDCCEVVDESLFLSLCFRPCKASLRKWLLQNACRFSVRPSVMLTVLLGFTKDPYPHTRKAALDGLVMLCGCVAIEDLGLVEGCYNRAVELLFDAEDYVRCAAVRTVSKLGNLLVVSNQEKSKMDWSDAIFLQLCSMVRDMSMVVRVEAFVALGRVGMVSEYILLQTLAKKPTSATKDMNFPGQYSLKVLNLPAATAAFAFVHGLEDEYYEVRTSACHAIRNLTVLSTKFSDQALNYLMDLLNDDSVLVRVEVLETMHQIALCGHLKVEEEHLHMFLWTLTDNNMLVRSAARRSLHLFKLSKLSLFKLCINSLTRSLEVYSQDEADLFSTMFKIGQGHGKFVTSVIQEAAELMEPSLEVAFGFDDAKTTALLILAMSAPVSLEQHICTIPPRIYSYAVTMLGRIARGLTEVVTQSTLLLFLSCASRCTIVPMAKFQNEETVTGTLEDHFKKILAPVEMVNPVSVDDLLVHSELVNFMNLILQNVKHLWPLVKLGRIDEVTQTLRNWKDELKLFRYKSSKHHNALAFTQHYLDIVELLGQSWLHVLSPDKLPAFGMVESVPFLKILCKSLVEMKNRYICLSKEQQSHILGLMVVTCTLRLSDGEACCSKDLLKTISELELMSKEDLCDLTSFVIEIKALLQEMDFLADGVLENQHLFINALEHFSLQPFTLSGELRHKEAAVYPQEENHFLNPLPFVPKLPLGIPLRVVLYNVSSEDRLWLRITIENMYTQFVFIDMEGDEGSGDQRKFTVVAPCYATPNAKSFSLKVCIVLECTFMDTKKHKHSHGPKHEVVSLGEETEVFFGVAAQH